MKVCRDLLAPLIRADGGEIHVVQVTADEIQIHLSGTCAGCPGSTMTRERLLEPALLSIMPKATVRVTTGWRIPEGARKVE
jgi:Fe-S cluster biogenesis protein NfuA